MRNTRSIFAFCLLALLFGLIQCDKRRLICQAEGEDDENEEEFVLNDEIIKAINSLIDSKLQDIEGKIEGSIWKRMMDVPQEESTLEKSSEIARKKQCHFKYEDKCFAFFHAEVMTYSEGQLRCNDMGGHMANIYSKIHEDLMINYMKGIDVGPVFFFIGMTIDTDTMKVSLQDGTTAPYVHWYPDGGYPQKGHNLIRYTILPTFSGMFNNVDAKVAKSSGVLCEF